MSPTLLVMSSAVLVVAFAGGMASVEATATATSSAVSVRSTDPPITKTLTSERIDLGSLGGRGASAAAVDGNVVVGFATRADGKFRAFAYDLEADKPVMRGLGTLGGDNSEATDIEGSVVVGESELRNGRSHAFAYDLSEAEPRMVDLGTLGGASSTAIAVDGPIVVGNAEKANGAQRAFVYDLSARRPVMRGLGTLGGGFSQAVGVDGSLVVGDASRPGNLDEPSHAFVFNLSAADPRMEDLGTLGAPRTSSEATAVSGRLVTGRVEDEVDHAVVFDLRRRHPAVRDLGRGTVAAAVDQGVVVGSQDSRRGVARHAFALAMSRPSGSRRDLGTLGGGFSQATAVAKNIVVGQSADPLGGTARAFAFDLSARRGRISELDAPTGVESTAVDVDGQVVAGTTFDERIDDRLHAVAWQMSTTTQPAFRFKRFRSTIQEGVGNAVVTVVRDGTLSSPASVRYRARGSTASEGKDFLPVAGTLRFAAGQREQTFRVPIVNDVKAEPPEALTVNLRRASTGAILSTPRTTGISIATSDQRPDALIRTGPRAGYIGNDVYNVTGARQTRRLDARRGMRRTFFVRVENDGDTRVTITVKGRRARADSRVRYFHGATNITRALTLSHGLRLRISPGSVRQIRMRVDIGSRARIGSRKPALITATWRGDGRRTDLVRGVVHVTR
jgi:probable HAF family extracellular repeat protein